MKYTQSTLLGKNRYARFSFFKARSPRNQAPTLYPHHSSDKPAVSRRMLNLLHQPQIGTSYLIVHNPACLPNPVFVNYPVFEDIGK